MMLLIVCRMRAERQRGKGVVQRGPTMAARYGEHAAQLTSHYEPSKRAQPDYC